MSAAGTETRFGLVRPAVDAHTLGLSSVEQMLGDCGLASVIADAAACEAFGAPLVPRNAAKIEAWIRGNRITALGFSYRLDPEQGADLFLQLVHQLKQRRLLTDQGGPLRALYFAGLPRACEQVKAQCPEIAGTFCGDETQAETLHILGIDHGTAGQELGAGLAYDEGRLAFGKALIQKGDYLAVKPVARSGYDGFGTRQDSVVERVRHGVERGLAPLMRAHVGPYLPDRNEAVRLFLDWTRQLAGAGLLDVLSIGTSQLTQSDFGGDWSGKANGGGVPLNSSEEYAAVWTAARPMLVRTYAGTRNIRELAAMHERTLNIAWHALSLWWFCQIDGRGPYSVRENLEQHVDALKVIAGAGKPFEPNIPHHFAFRGADDVTCVVSSVLAAKLAKTLGIRTLILQCMLNTPKYLWGIQDLAKARAMLRLVRELQDDRFQVLLQPRGGLDYFSHDLTRAKAQLAAATALMDDIEPYDSNSPQIIHVVSYSEGSHLADPAVVNESIQITRHALHAYRQLRAKGQIDDMARHHETNTRTEQLVADARAVLQAIGKSVPQPYTASGLYQIFLRGFLPVPYLWECRTEFPKACDWQTRTLRGSVQLVARDGRPLSLAERLSRVEEGRTGGTVASV